MKNIEPSAPLIGVQRHRLTVDGKGVTTLVGFHGCTLHCKYCLNPHCLDPEGVQRTTTPSELLSEVALDNLYFQATGGGVTFGGGEPAMHSEFIEAFCHIAPPEWNITMETALNVDRAHLERLLPVVNQFIIDIKDINPKIYRRYTGRDNWRVIDNLRWLMQHDGMAERVQVRLPHIPGYNTDEDIQASRKFLAGLGITDFDEFTYELPVGERIVDQLIYRTAGIIEPPERFDEDIPPKK